MLHYKDMELRSRKPTYVGYADSEFDAFVVTKKITCDNLEHWLDSLLKNVQRKTFLDGRLNYLSRTTAKKDCPLVLLTLWTSHMASTEELEILEQKDDLYMHNFRCEALDWYTSDIAQVVAQNEVQE